MYSSSEEEGGVNEGVGSLSGSYPWFLGTAEATRADPSGDSKKDHSAF